MIINLRIYHFILCLKHTTLRNVKYLKTKCPSSSITVEFIEPWRRISRSNLSLFHRVVVASLHISLFFFSIPRTSIRQLVDRGLRIICSSTDTSRQLRTCTDVPDGYVASFGCSQRFSAVVRSSEVYRHHPGNSSEGACTQRVHYGQDWNTLGVISRRGSGSGLQLGALRSRPRAKQLILDRRVANLS